MVSCGHQIVEADDDRLPPPQTFYMPEARYRPPLDHVLVHHYHTVRNSDGSEGARPTSRWMDWTGKLARISSMLNGLPDERLDLTADGLRIFVIPEYFEHDGVEAFLDWVTDLDNEVACYGLEQGQQVAVPIPGVDFEIRQAATVYGLCTWLDLHPNISRVELRHHIASYIAGGFIKDTEEACYVSQCLGPGDGDLLRLLFYTMEKRLLAQGEYDEAAVDTALSGSFSTILEEEEGLLPSPESPAASDTENPALHESTDPPPGLEGPVESDAQDQAWQMVGHDGTAHSDHSNEADEPSVPATTDVTGPSDETQKSSAPTPGRKSYAAALKHTQPEGWTRTNISFTKRQSPQW